MKDKYTKYLKEPTPDWKKTANADNAGLVSYDTRIVGHRAWQAPAF